MVTVTELNRAPDGRFESLEATGSFTDPAGISYDGAINPVQVTEEASTFAESDITLTQTNTTISDGSVELSGTQTSGDVVVEWDSGVPADLDSYDLATYQITEDNETVTIDVVEPITSDLIIDDFEDDDINIETSNWSGWTGDTGSFTAQQNTVINGSFTAELTASDARSTVEAEAGSPYTDNFKFKIQIDSRSDNDIDDVYVNLREQSTGPNLGLLEWDDQSELQWVINGTDNTVLSSWSTNTTYTVEFDFDFNNDNTDIIVNGTNEGTFSLEESPNGLGWFSLSNGTGSSGITRNVYADDFTLINATSNPSVLFSDISQNFDISTVDTSKNVKLRANLSRTDTANNPTVDYLARRFNRS